MGTKERRVRIIVKMVFALLISVYIILENSYISSAKVKQDAKPNEKEVVVESESVHVSKVKVNETQKVTKSSVTQEQENEEDVQSSQEEKPDVEPDEEKVSNSSDTTQKIRWMCRYFIEECGFTPEGAAGVIGNIAVESYFDSAVISDAGYYGLCQWNTSSSGNYWWYTIEEWITSNGYEWNSFEGQIRAIGECPSKGQLTQERFEDLKNCRNVEEATEIFCVFYEGCVGTTGNGDAKPVYCANGYTYQSLQIRKNEAWIAYQMYKNGTEYNGMC